MAGTTMTTVSLPENAWTQVLAAGPTSATIYNLGTRELMIRIGGSVSSGDALTAAHDMLNPGEFRALTLNALDAIYACPRLMPTGLSNGPGVINVRA